MLTGSLLSLPLPLAQVTDALEQAADAQGPGQGIVEPFATAVLLAALGILITFSVVFSRTAERAGVPIVLLFLVIGMIGGSEGLGGFEFDDYGLAVRLGTIALVLILFDGGLNTAVASVRPVLWPSVVLATLGVVLTAALVAGFGWLVGISLPVAILLGAVVSSTDAAAVFAVLRGGNLNLKPHIGRTIELESCINDPMAIILTFSAISIISAEEPFGWRMLADVPIQLGVGAAVGALVGWVGCAILLRVRLATAGLFPPLTLAFAFLSFGAATLGNGSGFLATFVTGLMIGNYHSLPYRNALRRVHDAFAWLAQIGMFLMLGLLVYPSRLLDVAWIGLGVGLFLAVVARPVVVGVCLWPFKYSLPETAYVGWTGLRAAVPIVLATFPLLADVEGAYPLFNLVFFVVVVSSFIPGSTLRWVTRRMRMDVPTHPTPPAALEINSATHLKGELMSFYIEPSLAVCGAKLMEIPFPAGSAIVLIVRGEELLAARGSTELENGDHVYVFCRPEDRTFINLLFGQPE